MFRSNFLLPFILALASSYIALVASPDVSAESTITTAHMPTLENATANMKTNVESGFEYENIM